MPPAGMPVARPPVQLIAEQKPAAPSGQSADDLKAAIADIKRRLAEQREAATSERSVSELAEELKAARLQIERLTQAMNELRTERDALRGQLVGTRDELQGLQNRLSTAEAGGAQRVQALEQELAKQQSARADVEAQLAERDEKLKKATGEVAALTQQLSGDAQTQRSLSEQTDQLKRQLGELTAGLDAKDEALQRTTAALEEKRAEAARLDQELAAVRAESARAADQAAERERALQAERDAANAKAAALAKEVEELRAVAAASVEEVKTIGEQLIAALADSKALTAALAEVRASEALLGQELQASRRDVQAYRAEAEQLRARDGAASATAPATVAATLTKLEATVDDSPAPAAGPPAAGETWASTRLDGSVFTAGSSELRQEAAPMLAAVADFIRAQGAREVRVVGHTDANGENEVNRLLSVRRAEKVRDYLVANFGFEAARIAAEGRGEDEPVASNDTAAGRRANRRVEIYARP